MSLALLEIRRALHRRVVWVLVAVALAGIVAAGLVVFFDSVGMDVAAVRAAGDEHPAVVRHWWVPGTGEGVLVGAAFMLVLGGLIGGASVAGAEWRAGTVGTLLTWEPRRLRVHGARAFAVTVCAATIAFALQAALLAAFVPAVVAHGSAAGVDGPWVVALLAAMARISLVTALAAVAGASLASIGRNTTAALVLAWGWLAVGEGLVRSIDEGLRRLLLGENMAVLLTWADLSGDELGQSPVVSLVTLGSYAAAVVLLAALRFRHADVGS